MSVSQPSRESITVSRAREIILQASPGPVATELVCLSGALNRIAAVDISAANPLPCYTNSAMDGYAFCYDEVALQPKVTLKIAGHSFAGAPCLQTGFEAGACIEIATGAALPESFDTVIPFEKCQIHDSDQTISFNLEEVKYGANVRHKGEQLRSGQLIVPAGVCLKPQHIALLAAAGISEVSVYKKIQVTLLATGSELVEPGKPLGRFQTYDSNTVMLETMLHTVGCLTKTVSLRDDAQSIAQAMEECIEQCDMLILTGGAGNGKFDLSQHLLNSQGQMLPWFINMRPGRPMRFGQIQNKPVFVLPGNPVAAFVTFLEFSLVALYRMQGRKDWPAISEQQAILACDLKKKAGRAEFMRAKIVGYEGGVPVVEPLSNQSSADLLMLSQTDVIVCLDHEPDCYRKGQLVTIQSLREIGLR